MLGLTIPQTLLLQARWSNRTCATYANSCALRPAGERGHRINRVLHVMLHTRWSVEAGSTGENGVAQSYSRSAARSGVRDVTFGGAPDSREAKRRRAPWRC